MTRPLARLMSLFAAQTLRNGGDFAEPDYSERCEIKDLEQKGPPCPPPPAI